MWGVWPEVVAAHWAQPRLTRRRLFSTPYRPSLEPDRLSTPTEIQVLSRDSLFTRTALVTVTTLGEPSTGERASRAEGKGKRQLGRIETPSGCEERLTVSVGFARTEERRIR